MLTDSAARFREEGDRLRDNKEWEAAAAAYAEYLRTEVNDWPIRVQFGHCLKEAGNVEQALRQYRLAEAEAPADPDVKLQIGHALKLLKRFDEAVQAYAAALALQPDNADIQENLSSLWEHLGTGDTEPLSIDVRLLRSSALGSSSADAVTLRRKGPAATLPRPTQMLNKDRPSASRLIIDVSDLIGYLEHNPFPTGIQRVQLEITESLLRNQEYTLASYFSPEDGEWYFLDRVSFSRIYEEAISLGRAEAGTRHSLSHTVRALRQVAERGVFLPGDALLNLGTSWAFSGYQRAVLNLRSQIGICFIQFVHDCIPLLFPHLCDDNTVQNYARWFSAATFICDGFVTNSVNTANDFIRLQTRAHGPLCCPVVPVALNGNMRALHEAAGLTGVRKAATPYRYVLFVSTLEPRKDHGFVFDAWRRLIEQRGEDAVPKIICVGRVGWKVGRLLARHANDPLLRRNVILKHNISEVELSTLYSGALFTIYNSLYEGWGLPISESLSYGKVPVVPAHSALVEAGGDCAAYFTPGSLESFVSVVSSLIEGDTVRAASEGAIMTKSNLRSWDDVAEDIGRAVSKVVAHAADHSVTAAFRLGRLYRTRYRPSSHISLDTAAVDAACVGSGWHGAENWGIWTRGNKAELRIPFRTDKPAGGKFKVALAMFGPPVDVELRIVVEEEISSTRSPEYRKTLAGNKREGLKLDISIAPEQAEAILKITLSAPEAVCLSLGSSEDHRETLGALIGFMIMEEGDIGAALDFDEKLRFEEAEIAD